MVEQDRRRYDLLRLIRDEEPVGSIRLTDLMQRRGYTIQGRTIRLALSELDEAGLTEKVPGRGRKLTDQGRHELDHGDVTGRLAQVREQIATLTDKATYTPYEDAGTVVTTTVTVPDKHVTAALNSLQKLDMTPIGPVVEAIDEDGAMDGVQFTFPSSITVEGAFLSQGIDIDLQTGGLVEYQNSEGDEDRRSIIRFIDTISGAESTMDVVRLLIEAGRTDVVSVLDGHGTLIVDNYEFPIRRLNDGLDLVTELSATIGGVADVRRPREDGPFPATRPSFDFASLTFGGVGEIALALFVEKGYAASWETLSGTVDREACVPTDQLASQAVEFE